MFGLKFVRKSEWQNLVESYKGAEEALQDVLGMKILMSSQQSGTRGSEAKNMVEHSRLLFKYSPLGWLPIQLTTWFALGTDGIKPTAVKEPKHRPHGIGPTVEEQRDFLEEFWEDPINQKAFADYTAQEQLANKLQIDGDLFMLINCDDAKNRFRAMPLDLLEIGDIISDPTDPIVELFYKRAYQKIEYSFTAGAAMPKGQKVGYHRSTESLTWQPSDDFPGPDDKSLLAGWIYHITFGSDPTEHWGWPALTRAADWIEHHKGMAGDLRTLVRALATIMADVTIKPGRKSDVQRVHNLADKLVDRLARRPTIGSEYLHGPQIERKPVDVKTGAADMTSKALKDMVLMVCAATGIPYQYTGDPSTGNLATAKTMELPLIRKTRSFQAIMCGLYEGIMNFILRNKYGDWAGRVETSFPDILERDILEFLQALDIAMNRLFVDEKWAREQAKHALETRV
jgi:hypothetical protein